MSGGKGEWVDFMRKRFFAAVAAAVELSIGKIFQNGFERYSVALFWFEKKNEQCTDKDYVY